MYTGWMFLRGLSGLSTSRKINGSIPGFTEYVEEPHIATEGRVCVCVCVFSIKIRS